MEIVYNNLVSDARQRVAEVVVGQDVVVERLLIGLFTGGHLLLQGMPGLAKTLLVQTISKTINLIFGRVQFTIDLLQRIDTAPPKTLPTAHREQLRGTIHELEQIHFAPQANQANGHGDLQAIAQDLVDKVS